MCKTCGCSFRSRDFGNIERFIEPCILLLLCKNSSHGYQLRENLKEHCGHKIDIGNLYRTLRRMEKDDWISSDWQEGNGVPNKRTYSITIEGKEILSNAVISLQKTDKLIHRLFEGYQNNFQNNKIL